MSRPFVLGLTGSIGMGKSTTAEMFREKGVPVWDADAAVERAYAKGGGGAEAIASLRPDAVKEGTVDRADLKAWIAREPAALSAIEGVVHPIVARDRARFLAGCSAPVVLLDIPLLFETRLENETDAVVVVSAPPEVQRERVLARPGMTEDVLDTILARQMPDAEKRARADYIVETVSMDGARMAVRNIVEQVRERADARDRT